MLASYRLAIDFGTTNTTAALRRAGEPAMPLRLGAATNAIPSAVLVRGEEVVVGDEATRLAVLDPSSFERTPKRRLGQPAVLLGDRAHDPAALVAAVIAHVVGRARAQAQGQAPEEVLVTHPQAWGPHLVDELRRAACLAEDAVLGVRLLSEPVAAASAYRDVLDGGQGQRVAVADFGGGTFDVALLESAPGAGLDSLRVVGADGVDPLGGDDFDAMLEQWVFDQLRAEGRSDLVRLFDDDEHLASRLTLRDELRRAKHALSHHASAPVLVTLGSERLVVTITAAEFEAMIRPSIDRALDVSRGLLGGVTVDHLFLTGGSSLIPLVQREFQQLTGGRVGTLGDPKEITAVGALRVPLGTSASALRFLPPPVGAPHAERDRPAPEPANERVPEPATERAPNRAAASTTPAERPPVRDSLVRTARAWLFAFVGACALLALGFVTNSEVIGNSALVLFAVTAVGSAIAHGRWFAREWRRSGADVDGPSAGTAVAGSWIPVANLYLAGARLSHLVGRAHGTSSLGTRTRAWWLLWVTGQVLVVAVLLVAESAGSADGLIASTGVGACAVLGGSAMAMAGIVRDVATALDPRTREETLHG